MTKTLAFLLAVLMAASAWAQTGTSPTSPTGLPFSPGVPGLLNPPSTSATSSSVATNPDVVVTGTLGALNAAVTVTLGGKGGVGFTLAAGLDATLTPEISFDNQGTWIGTHFVNYSASSTTFGNTTASKASASVVQNLVVVVPPGATDARVRVSLYTSGSAAARIIATGNVATIPPYAVAKVAAAATNAVGVMNVGGRDTNSAVRSAVFTTQSLTTTTDDFSMLVEATPSREVRAMSVSVDESVAAPTAATWYVKRRFTLGANAYYLYPTHAYSTVTTAGSRTAIQICMSFGTFDVSSNVFTDGSVAQAPRQYSRVFAVVNTVLSATPTNVTLTYNGNEPVFVGHTTAALTIPASAPVGNAFEFTLAATTGQERDPGISDVTAVSDTAAPTGVIEIWGCNPLFRSNGAAGVYESQAFGDSGFRLASDETVMIMFYQAATTAEQRTAGFVGGLR